MRWSLRAVLSGAVLFAMPAAGTAGDLVINEILYDPEGPDADGEFVELHNPTVRSVSLAGVTLEAGNGDRPGDWRAQWTGGSGEQLAAGAYYVVAATAAPVPADARVRLRLQNGPDAVRLVRAGEVLDCVGWGRLLHAEFFEREPAPDAPAGFALARLPDGVDTGSNYHDFLARPWATAGSTNAPAFGIRVEEVVLDPPLIEPGEETAVRAEVRNIGADPLEPLEVELEFLAAGLRFGERWVPSRELGAGEVGQYGVSAVASAGAWTGEITVSVAYRGQAAGPFARALRVGRGSVLISEILYDPRQDEGEWVELANLSSEAVALDGWTLRDASQTEIVFDALRLEPGMRVIAAQDGAAFQAGWPQVDAHRLVTYSGSWPSLNNREDRVLGYADALLLCDADGRPSDYITYGTSEFDGDGISLERWIDGGRLVSARVLVPCPEAGGATPADISRAVEETMGEGHWLGPAPNPFYPERSGERVLCCLSVPAPAAPSARLTAEVFDLAGRRRCSLTAAARLSQPAVLSWDGCDAERRPLPTGLYVWRIALQEEGAAVSSRANRCVTLIRD